MTEKRKKEKKKEKSGHYVIASSLPPKQRPLERRMLVPISGRGEGYGIGGFFGKGRKSDYVILEYFLMSSYIVFTGCTGHRWSHHT